MNNDELRRTAESVASIAADMSLTVAANANPERVSRAVNAFTTALRPEGNNSDALMALGVMAAVHAYQAAEDCGSSPEQTLSIIATVIGMIATNAVPVSLPTDPKQIN